MKTYIRKNLSSLQGKLVFSLGTALIIIIMVVVAFTIGYCSKTFEKNEHIILSETNDNVVLQVENYFESYKTIIRQLSVNPTIQNIMNDASTDESIADSKYYKEVLKLLNGLIELDNTNILSVYFGDLDTKQILNPIELGLTTDPNFDTTTRDWFVKAQEEEIYVSNPYTDFATGDQIVSIASRVMNDQGEFIGVVSIDILIHTLTTMMENNHMGKTGFFVLISNNGKIISHQDKEKVLKNIEEIGVDKRLLNNLTEKNKEPVKFKIKEKKYIGAAVHIPSIKWDIVGMLPEKEFYADTNKTKSIIILSNFITIMGLLIGLYIIVKIIIKPVKKLTKVTDLIAKGQLDVDIDIKDGGEIGQFANSLEALILRLKENIGYIDEVSDTLGEFAEGNLKADLKHSYEGEFRMLKTAILNVSSTLGDTIGRLVDTSNEISGGAEMVAQGAQALASGALDETKLINNITTTCEQMAVEISRSARGAKEVNTFFKQVKTEIHRCDCTMNEMLKAMNHMQDTSHEIGKIIKVIEDIAFQTNILALNAAVEAARAGGAGKGFAVVADEVRNLASKSAQAAKNTNDLIGNSIEKVKEGKTLTDIIANSLSGIAKQTQEIALLIEDMSSGIVAESDSADLIVQNVKQMSEVVSSTLATSEEIAAISEEFSNQANLLTEVTNKFQI